MISEQTDLFNTSIRIADGFSLELSLLLLIFLIVLARPVVLIFDGHCDISEHHVRQVFGKCSTRLNEVSIPIEELRGVRVDQSVVERMLGIGTVVAWTQSGVNPEINVKGIANPQLVADAIMKRIDLSQIDRKAAAKPQH